VKAAARFCGPISNRSTAPRSVYWATSVLIRNGVPVIPKNSRKINVRNFHHTPIRK
jgi:hypothetical protein